MATRRSPLMRRPFVGPMKSGVLRSGQNLKIVQGIVQCVAVAMMHMLVGGELAAEVLFHHKPVLGFVAPVADMNVDVAILDVTANVLPDRLGLSVPAHQGVVVHAETLGNSVVLTPVDRALPSPIVPDSLDDARIAIAPVSLIVQIAQADGFGDASALCDRTDHGLTARRWVRRASPPPSRIVIPAPSSGDDLFVTTINRACIHAESIATSRALCNCREV